MQPIEGLFRAAVRAPNEIAVIAPDRRATFAELAAETMGLAAFLKAQDPAPQARVCVGCKNSVEHLIAILAVLAAGKTWVALNPHNGDPELHRIVEFTEPAAMLVDENMAGRIGRCGVATYLLDGPDTVFRRARNAQARFTPTYAPLDATTAIKFTGGTSGTPKGVMQPYRCWNTCIATQRHLYNFTPRDRYLVNAPLTHGASTYILPVLGAGGAFVFPEDTKPETLLRTITEHAVTTFFAPPTMIQMLVDAARRVNTPTSTLRNIIYGGAPMRPSRIGEAQDAFGPVIHATFGQTEAPQIITYLSAAELTDPDNLASAGRPTLLTGVGIMDQANRLLSAGELGEVVVRGDLVMTGYLNMPDKTAETIIDGWLHTGDLGLFDERGYLFLRDRSREVIITGGFNVYPSDVETVLSRHPAVADCVVFGIPDDHWGEAVHAAVEPKPHAAVDVRDVIAFLKRELGSVKAPKGLHVFASLPKSAVGKVLKKSVRDEVIAMVPAESKS
ncbi:MAG: class I adenylate-forming enzyme family protein [Xanthobacteraceae bacterium]